MTIRDPFEKLAGDEDVAVYPGKVDHVPAPEEHEDEKDCVCPGHQDASGSGRSGGRPSYTVPFNEGEPVTRLCVKNPTDRPIQVGSHFHFYEANTGYTADGESRPGLDFARAEAYGKRLNIASGTSERFEPGDERCVELVPIKGQKTVKGLQIKPDADGGKLDEKKITAPAVPGTGTDTGTTRNTGGRGRSSWPRR
ncbi:urease subunit beta [Streptomyces sp. NPDC017529]|uniref:urease subunit beta n=1 Tax=Streptomyces sp. NPDC017529 TaxID=3365000 RepID=UPI0037B8FE75